MTMILGLETSCDETAAAVVEDGWLVRASVVASQHHLHERYGGVVPEIASRAHLERLNPVVDATLQAAKVKLNEIDAIAVGNRPGLIGSLLVGVSAAKTLAWATGKPLLGIDHIHAHLYAAGLSDFTDSKSEISNPVSTPQPLYPALGLVVSGGHTSLYELTSPTELRLLGRTIDDAVGEAYDKAAVILDAGYPGGPKLDRLAQTGDAGIRRFPRSMLGGDSLDFSFSGLKTSLLYAVRDTGGMLSDRQRADFAAAFQDAAIDALVRKLERALGMLAAASRPACAVIIGGGVSANSLLRRQVAELGARCNLPTHIPAMKYCVDNAAMIAGLAYEHLRGGNLGDLALPAVTAGG